MKKPPEKYRIDDGPLASSQQDGNNGAFLIPHPRPKIKGQAMLVIISDGLGWEHASVSIRNRHNQSMKITPTWDDMCYIKNIFWNPSETVIQYHPAAENYVNNHPHCLHLWRPTAETLPIPAPIMVGIPNIKIETPKPDYSYIDRL